MQTLEPNRKSAPEGSAKGRAPSPLRRLAALFVLLALLAAAAISSWWILSNQADFFAADGRRAARPADAAPR